MTTTAAQSPDAPTTTRLVTSADLPSILALTRLVPEAPWWSEAHLQQIVATEVAEQAPQQVHFRRGWVASSPSHAAKISGFLVLQLLRVDGSLEAEIEALVVDPHLRRIGIGRALLATAKQWCGQQGATTIRLEVRSSNNAAIQLYQRAGFITTGTRPGYYESPPDDALLMELQLAG